MRLAHHLERVHHHAEQWHLLSFISATWGRSRPHEIVLEILKEEEGERVRDSLGRAITVLGRMQTEIAFWSLPHDEDEEKRAALEVVLMAVDDLEEPEDYWKGKALTWFWCGFAEASTALVVARLVKL